jgi:hypothetical protein
MSPLPLSRQAFALLLLGLLAVCRWPGVLPPNFSPVYALAFCAGVYLPGRLAWWLPMGILLITDVILNLHYRVPILSSYMALNYVAYAALIGLGRRFSARSSWLHLLGGGLLGALLFYFITNTAAWFNPTPGPFTQMPYPKTFLGWVQALTMGTSPWPPTWTFFRNTLLSGGLFTALFVGAIRCLSSSTSPGAETADEPADEPLAPEPEPS